MRNHDDLKKYFNELIIAGETDSIHSPEQLIKFIIETISQQTLLAE